MFGCLDECLSLWRDAWHLEGGLGVECVARRSVTGGVCEHCVQSMPRIALEVHMNPFEHLHIYATVFSVGCVGGVERVTYFVPPAACYVLQAMGTNCASGKAMPLTSPGGITNTPNSGECYDWFVSSGHWGKCIHVRLGHEQADRLLETRRSTGVLQHRIPWSRLWQLCTRLQV